MKLAEKIIKCNETLRLSKDRSKGAFEEDPDDFIKKHISKIKKMNSYQFYGYMHKVFPTLDMGRILQYYDTLHY